MCVFGIIHLVYKALRDLLDLFTQLVALLQCTGPRAVQSRTAGVRKCCLRQSASNGLVNWRVAFRNIHLVDNALRDLPGLCTQLMALLRCTGPGAVQS